MCERVFAHAHVLVVEYAIFKPISLISNIKGERTSKTNGKKISLIDNLRYKLESSGLPVAGPTHQGMWNALAPPPLLGPQFCQTRKPKTRVQLYSEHGLRATTDEITEYVTHAYTKHIFIACV